jgi:hypothetical protein
VSTGTVSERRHGREERVGTLDAEGESRRAVGEKQAFGLDGVDGEADDFSEASERRLLAVVERLGPRGVHDEDTQDVPPVDQRNGDAGFDAALDGRFPNGVGERQLRDLLCRLGFAGVERFLCRPSPLEVVEFIHYSEEVLTDSDAGLGRYRLLGRVPSDPHCPIQFGGGESLTHRRFDFLPARSVDDTSDDPVNRLADSVHRVEFVALSPEGSLSVVAKRDVTGDADEHRLVANLQDGAVELVGNPSAVRR